MLSFERDGKWFCEKCGCCCRGEPVRILLPHLYDPNTQACRFLLPDNTCLVYGSRPSICHTRPDQDDSLKIAACFSLYKKFL